MSTSVNAGGRLDRLPIGPFHRRIMLLIGIGMFFDGFDIYIAGTVLGVDLEDRLLDTRRKTRFHFGDLRRHDAGLVCHRLSRRPLRTALHLPVQSAVFGVASLAAAFAPNMTVLIACRFVMGFGLGRRKRCRLFDHDRIRAGTNARQVARPDGGLRRDRPAGPLLVASLVVPEFGWRAMFVIGGIGALDRLVHAQEPAGIAALARSRRPHRRS